MRKTKIVTKFLSRQLHSSRRFAPGYSDNDEAVLKRKTRQGYTEGKRTVPKDKPETEPISEPEPVEDLPADTEPETAAESIETKTAPPEPEPANAPEPIQEEDALETAETVKTESPSIAEPKDEPDTEPAPEPEPVEDLPADTEPETAAEPTETKTAPPEPEPEPAPPEPPDLNSILARESNAAYDTAKRRELAELKRHRREVMQHLHELRTNIEQEKEALEAKFHFFTSLLDELQNFSDQTGEDAIRELRQAVNNAHMECLKAEQQKNNENQNEEIINPSASIMALTSLSFSQLTKIGSGLLWPVLAALLAAGGIIAATIYAVFTL